MFSNVFVLSTGRCGSTTFAQACQHIQNYTVSHESRISLIGDKRLQYSQNHIEVDNRLSWFLGSLDKNYGDCAFYVHLKRDLMLTAKSYAKRLDSPIIKGYSESIILPKQFNYERLDVCIDYCNTVNANIEVFIKNKSNKMEFKLENAQEDFGTFWSLISATGNYAMALKEWEKKYNA
ncbi:hypothetical protein [Moorena producens]|uniref:hypothetical protein n=1 Tax=Moorena producens TaxID=1155739 RepID=UPI003C7368F6